MWCHVLSSGLLLWSLYHAQPFCPGTRLELSPAARVRAPVREGAPASPCVKARGRAASRAGFCSPLSGSGRGLLHAACTHSPRHQVVPLSAEPRCPLLFGGVLRARDCVFTGTAFCHFTMTCFEVTTLSKGRCLSAERGLTPRGWVLGGAGRFSPAVTAQTALVSGRRRPCAPGAQRPTHSAAALRRRGVSRDGARRGAPPLSRLTLGPTFLSGETCAG